MGDLGFTIDKSLPIAAVRDITKAAVECGDLAAPLPVADAAASDDAMLDHVVDACDHLTGSWDDDSESGLAEDI